MTKDAATRQRACRARKRERGLAYVGEWVKKADVSRLRAYAARLRAAGEKR